MASQKHEPPHKKLKLNPKEVFRNGASTGRETSISMEEDTWSQSSCDEECEGFERMLLEKLDAWLDEYAKPLFDLQVRKWLLEEKKRLGK